MDTVLTVAQIVLAVLGGAIVTLHVIAPITKTNKDDAVLTALQWLEAALRRFLPAPSPAVAKLEEKANKDLRSI